MFYITLRLTEVDSLFSFNICRKIYSLSLKCYLSEMKCDFINSTVQNVDNLLLSWLSSRCRYKIRTADPSVSANLTEVLIVYTSVVGEIAEDAVSEVSAMPRSR